MSRVISRLITIIVIVAAISVVISLFTGPRFKKIEIEIPDKDTVSQRASAIMHSFPVTDSSGYSIPDLNRAFNHLVSEHAYTPVDINFYLNNKLDGMLLDMSSVKLLDKNYQLDEKFANNVIEYINTLRVNPKQSEKAQRSSRLPVTHIRFLSHINGINNGSDSEVSTTALENQFRFLAMLQAFDYKRDTTASCITGIVELGTYSRKMEATQGKAIERSVFENSVQNILNAMKKVQMQYPPIKFCIAFTNSLPANGDDLALGMDPTKLKTALEALINKNKIQGNVIPDLENRASIILDTAAIFAALNQKNTELKNSQGEAYDADSLISVLKETLVKKDAQGKIVKRYLSSIIASLYTNENFEKVPSAHLAYTRAKNATEIMQQLNFLNDLVEISQLGMPSESASYLLYAIPRREIFPLLHNIARPLAETLGLIRKVDGASSSEQSYSIDLIRRFLTYKLR